MATRLYLASWLLYPVPVFTSWDAGWEDTSLNPGPAHSTLGNALPLTSPSAAAATADTTYSNTGVTVAGPADVLVRAFITPALDVDQTITGTVTGQIRASESNVNADAMMQMGVRVLQPDLSTIRGTLLALHANALSSELATGANITNRTLPLLANSPATLSSVSAIAGDFLLIEIGVRKTEAGTTSRNYNIASSTASASDLPADETTTTADNPWVEFSQNLTFTGLGPRIGSQMCMGIGA